MAAPPTKGTRKTYSFEEREILINLISKHAEVKEKGSDPVSMCKRKSAWSQLADEYNSMVGPHGSRSAVQLRRCWENMKACKRNREQKKIRSTKSLPRLTKDYLRIKKFESRNQSQKAEKAQVSTGLPPNVVFEPKDSEPFTFQSVSTPQPSNLDLNKETCNTDPDFSENKMNPNSLPIARKEDCLDDRLEEDLDSIVTDQFDDEISENERLFSRSNILHPASSVSVIRDYSHRNERSIGKEEELHVLAVSEAQMKVDLAAMLKEEARIKLEEAHYRKEEARVRMLFFTHKLEKIKEHDSGL